MDRKRMQKTKYLAVFATTTLIFLIGIMVGNFFANIKLDQVNDIEQQLKVDTLGTELQFALLAQQPCESINSTPLVEELHELSVKLDHMENLLGKKNKEVLHLKDYYAVLELRQWLLEKEINNKCNKDSILILYFYSNDEDICDKCEEQGFILTYIRKNFRNVNVYSFDMDSENPAVGTIKNLFSVGSVPTLIIENEAYPGFHTGARLTEIIEDLRNGYKNETEKIENIEENSPPKFEKITSS